MPSIRRLCLLLAAGVFSTFGAMAGDLSAYNAALADFETLLKAEARKGSMPRQTAPQVADLLDRVTDRSLHQDRADDAPGDFAPLLKACTRTHGLLLEYTLFAVRGNPAMDTLVRERKLREAELLLDAGFSAFQPEMGRLESFVLLCNGKVIGLADAFAGEPLSGQALQAFRKGVELMRRSDQKLYAGSVRRALNPALPADYRLQLLTALDLASPRFGLIFTPEIKDELLRQIAQGRYNLPGEMQGLADTMTSRLATTACTRLCSE